MSYTLFVEGKITETTGGAHNVFSDKIIAFNANGVISQTGEENGVTFGEPKSAPPFEVNNIYVKVRIKEPYNGEFGFDWVDVHPDTKDIEKIQGVDFSNVEYFYKKGATRADLGNIIKTDTDETKTGAKTAITENYVFNMMCKHIDLPYVLIKPGQEIILSAEIIACDGTFNQDEIKITGDKFFEFEIMGGEKEGETAKIKVAKAGKIDFKIKCLQEAPAQKRYEFFHSNATNANLPVGGVVLMENKVLELKFRVIALVSNDNDPNAKAQALFKKFKKAMVKDYLNNNSLNQAGYKVVIENFDAMDAADVDDYLYAFDKADWTDKKYFANINKQKPDVDPATGYCKTGSWDPVKKECAKILVPTDVIVDNQKDLGLPDKANEIDRTVIAEYKKRLKIKGKPYEGGIIILGDFESSDIITGAYSRVSPLNHYALIIYSTNTSDTDTYAHEIGHMLGLDHLFFDTKELNSFNNSKNYYQTLKTKLTTKTRETYPYYTYKQTKAKISTLKESLNNFISNRRNYIAEKERDLAQGRIANGNFTYNGKPVTKAQYLALIQADINTQKTYINENRNAIDMINSNSVKDFDDFKADFNILKNDSIKLDKEFIKFYEREWEQIEANFLRFKKATTKNIMDYDNIRVCFLSHQIKIMRNDIKNY